MACAIGCWIKETALTQNKQGIETTKALMSSMTTSKRFLDTTIDGMLQNEKLRIHIISKLS